MFNYRNFTWVNKELLPAEIAKADAASGGYKWKRKDGSWWTNHGGQIVPYHEPTHGSRDEHSSRRVGELHDAAHAALYHTARAHESVDNSIAAGNNMDRAKNLRRTLAIEHPKDKELLDQVMGHGADEGGEKGKRDAVNAAKSGAKSKIKPR